MLGLIALSAVACGADPTPTATPMPSPTPVPSDAHEPHTTTADFEFEDCLFDPPQTFVVECGFLSVPADYLNADAGRFELAVAIYRTSNPNPKNDALVYLDGGPGAHTLALSQFAFPENLSPYIEDRDVILFDQRGVGFSRPALNCPELKDLAIDVLGQNISLNEESTLYRTALSACHARLLVEGVDLSLFNTAASAADVDRLRAALGYEEWNLLGVSYGTRLAQTVMRDFPSGVRRVILDSSYPLDHDLYAGIPAGADRAFDLLVDSCAANQDCATNYPDLEQALYHAFDRLNDVPGPGMTTVTARGGVIPTLMTGTRLSNAVFQSLYQTDMLAWLPEVITQAAAGDVAAATVLLSIDLINLDYVSTGQHYSVQCQDEMPFTSISIMEARRQGSSYFASLLDPAGIAASDQIAICAEWAVPTSPPSANEAISSTIPSLVLAGTYDPITPPSLGRAVASQLTNATFLEFPGTGHGVFSSSDCAQFVILMFLAANGNVDTSCVAELGHPDWVRPFDQIELVPFTDELTGVTGVRPAQWLSQAPGLFSRTKTGLHSVIHQVVPGIDSTQLHKLITRDLPENRTVSTSLHMVDEVTWELLEVLDPAGRFSIFATADFEFGSAAIGASGLLNQKGAMLEFVLLPSLAAFVPPSN